MAEPIATPAIGPTIGKNEPNAAPAVRPVKIDFFLFT
jgi:hypothetical protein